MSKSIVYTLVTIVTLCLVGCSSDPINPKIIGTTFLQQSEDRIYAEFDSVRYAPTRIYTGERVGRDGIDGSIKPVLGMQVTCFTSDIHKEPTYFAGEVTSTEIEEYFQRSYNGVFVFLGILLCIFVMALFAEGCRKKGPRFIGIAYAD